MAAAPGLTVTPNPAVDRERAKRIAEIAAELLARAELELAEVRRDLTELAAQAAELNKQATEAEKAAE